MDKHQWNIGATVGLVKYTHELTGHDDVDMPMYLASLFTAESDSCVSKVDGRCTFNAEEDLKKGDTFATPKCRVGDCPLGSLVDEELEKNRRLPE